MAQVLVRNIDEQVVSALKRKAELQGRSLEKMLREILTQAARLSPEERLRIARRIRAMTPVKVEQSDSTDLIREDRMRDEPGR